MPKNAAIYEKDYIMSWKPLHGKDRRIIPPPPLITLEVKEGSTEAEIYRSNNSFFFASNSS